MLIFEWISNTVHLVPFHCLLFLPGYVIHHHVAGLRAAGSHLTGAWVFLVMLQDQVKLVQHASHHLHITAVLQCTVLSCAILYFTLLYWTEMYCIALYCTGVNARFDISTQFF